MSRSEEATLYRRLQRKGFRPRTVAEVGVYLPEASNVRDFIADGCVAILVEPEPSAVARLRAAFGHLEHVILHPVAVSATDGRVQLYRRGASTFAADVTAPPSIVNDGYSPRDEDRFEAEGVTFDRIDDGNIDVLSVDAEGSEWKVLERLRSRPHVISLETHGAAYTHPRLGDILDWMEREGYRVWYRDRSDTVFVRRGTIAVTVTDRVGLLAANVRIRVRRARKSIRRRLGRRESVG